jgi:hypothetical protein
MQDRSIRDLARVTLVLLNLATEYAKQPAASTAQSADDADAGESDHACAIGPVSTSELDGPHLEPQAGGAARQLVVFLHSYGANGDELIEI